MGCSLEGGRVLDLTQPLVSAFGSGDRHRVGSSSGLHPFAALSRNERSLAVDAHHCASGAVVGFGHRDLAELRTPTAISACPAARR